jgi:hypothetical protein
MDGKLPDNVIITLELTILNATDHSWELDYPVDRPDGPIILPMECVMGYTPPTHEFHDLPLQISPGKRQQQDAKNL